MIHTAWSACRLTIIFQFKEKKERKDNNNTRTLWKSIQRVDFVCLSMWWQHGGLITYIWVCEWGSTRMHAVWLRRHEWKQSLHLFWKHCILRGFFIFKWNLNKSSNFIQKMYFQFPWDYWNTSSALLEVKCTKYYIMLSFVYITYDRLNASELRHASTAYAMTHLV